LEEIYADYETELQENVAEIRQELSEKVDEYLSYVAKEYVAENKLAVENKLKLEIMENFMSGLKKVFEENYVDVPEEKVDLYGEALETLEEKEQKLNEQFEKNIKLSKKLEDLEKEIILKDVTEGLTVSQAEKVRSLSESLEFTTKEDMMEKVTLIKDNYFPSETIVESAVLDESALETSVEDSPVVQEENKFQSVMDVYARALNRPKD
jgi:formyltetrahydrofolate synthetase